MNMLGDMDQPIAKVNDLDYGVGVFMADSCIYQRQLPDSCAGENDPTGVNAKAVDMSLPDFMGLAMPLIKHGLPVRPVQLDNVNRYPGYLKDYDVLILSYEFFKPDSPSINTSHRQLGRGGRRAGLCRRRKRSLPRRQELVETEW